MEEPDAREVESGLGDGTGDIDGLDGDEAADDGVELPLDGIASSAGASRGDLGGLEEPNEDEDGTDEDIGGRANAGRDKDDEIGL